jgi:sulfite exporter TauE/SafE
VQCYYHPERQALGTCVHCQRGLCSACLTLVDDRLACKDRHEPQVEASSRVLLRGIVQSERVASGYLRNAIFYGLAGIAFSGLGLMQYRFLGLQAVFFVLIGLFLLYAGVANLAESRKYR